MGFCGSHPRPISPKVFKIWIHELSLKNTFVELHVVLHLPEANELKNILEKYIWGLGILKNGVYVMQNHNKDEKITVQESQYISYKQQITFHMIYDTKLVFPHFELYLSYIQSCCIKRNIF